MYKTTTKPKKTKNKQFTNSICKNRARPELYQSIFIHAMDALGIIKPDMLNIFVVNCVTGVELHL